MSCLGRRCNAFVLQPSISWKCLEQPYDSLKESYGLGSCRATSGKATWFQCAHACSMSSPFMLPQLLVRTVIRIVFPERIHKVESRSSALSSKERRDASIVSRRITIFLEGGVAVIGPEAVNGPAIGRTIRRVCVPELRL